MSATQPCVGSAAFVSVCADSCSRLALRTVVGHPNGPPQRGVGALAFLQQAAARRALADVPRDVPNGMRQ
jgi:hypothetical protein